MHTPINIHIMITPTAPPMNIASLIVSMESFEESPVSIGVTVGRFSVLEVAVVAVIFVVVVVVVAAVVVAVVVVAVVVVGIIAGPVATPTVGSLLCCTPTQILLHNENIYSYIGS